MREYKFTIEDDQTAADFEQGLANAGLDVESLWQKEVGDFVQAARISAEEAKLSPVERPDVTTAKLAEVDGMAVEKLAPQPVP